jgi:hypothetical protein
LVGVQIVFIAPSLAARPLGIRSGKPAIALSSLALPVDLRHLGIGDTRRSSVTLTNSGSESGLYTLQIEGRGNSALLRRIDLTVTERDERSVRKLYRGPLAPTERLRLGRITPGGHRRLSFVVHLGSTGSSSGDAGLQERTAAISFRYTTVQTVQDW